MADDRGAGFAPEQPSRLFTEQEIRNIRDGDEKGLKSMLPARFYHDPALYQLEVDHILKKNWLCVGRWDWAEKPGDYFTCDMFGDPILIIRDKRGKLNALVNVCQHRWAKIVPDGSGHTKLLVCPYHSWTYELDGKLRGVSVEDIPNFDKKNCRMPTLRLEEWAGFVFISFDDNVAPLKPQLAGLDQHMGRFGVDQFRTTGRTDYETNWNYKFSFETGYEAYHHEGVHKTLLPGTAKFHRAIDFGEIWGAYVGEYPEEMSEPPPFGAPPWMSEAEAGALGARHSLFIGIYPNLIMFIEPHQVSYIVTQFKSVANNFATTAISHAPWTFDRPNAQARIDHQVAMMKTVQEQDTAGCRMLQGGIVSSFNKRSVMHQFETTLSHYYSWMVEQFLKIGETNGAA